MAYRDDLAALEARKAAAEAELLDKTRARDEVARLVEETRYLAGAEAAFGGSRPDSKWSARRRRRLCAVAVVAGVIAGGGALAHRDTTRPASPPPVIEMMFLQMVTYERALCACTDLAYPSSSECVQKISDEMTRWSTEVSKQVPVPPSLDEGQLKRVTALGESMGRCMHRAMAPPIEPPPPVVQPDPPACDEVSCILDNYEAWCCSAFRAPSASDLPEGLDRSMISAAIASVKAQVIACGEHSSATGKVKLHVKVDGAGRVTSASVSVAPDPDLGACVAAAVRKAKFAETRGGGSFSYRYCVALVP